MPFAAQSSDLSYWQKQTQPLFSDLFWNIPEQKTGSVALIGGHSGGFNSLIRFAEYLSSHFPVRRTSLLLPDALRGKLPPLENIDFAPSTSSGSLGKSGLISALINSSDFAVLPGDLSKNSETAVALSEALAASDPAKPLLLTRDAVDLLAPTADTFLPRENLFLVASMVQLQKIFRAVFYPKMIILSEPLLPAIETLHKFTLSYPGATILTFHSGQILVASAGSVVTTPIEATEYTPISLWSGPLAATITAFNLYNPTRPLEATSAAILYH